MFRSSGVGSLFCVVNPWASSLEIPYLEADSHRLGGSDLGSGSGTYILEPGGCLCGEEYRLTQLIGLSELTERKCLDIYRLIDNNNVPDGFVYAFYVWTIITPPTPYPDTIQKSIIYITLPPDPGTEPLILGIFNISSLEGKDTVDNVPFDAETMKFDVSRCKTRSGRKPSLGNIEAVSQVVQKRLGYVLRLYDQEETKTI